MASEPTMESVRSVTPRAKKVVYGSLIALMVLIALIGGLLAWSARDTTVYAAKFEESQFNRLEVGMALSDVYALLGDPLSHREESSSERWCYDRQAVDGGAGRFTYNDFFEPRACVEFDTAGRVSEIAKTVQGRVRLRMTKDQVLTVLGSPIDRFPQVSQTLHYASPGGDGLFKARIVAIDREGRVAEVTSYQFYD